VVLPPLLALLLPEFGWRLVWRGAGLIVALVIMPTILLATRNKPTEREGLHFLVDDGSAGKVLAHGAGGGALSWRDVIARRNFWLLVFIYLPIMAINGGVISNLGPFAASNGLSEQTAGKLISLLSAAQLVANLSLGILSDRFGNRLPLVGLSVLVALGSAVLGFGSGLPAIGAGCILVGFGGGVFTLLAAALAAEFGASGFGRAFGTAMFFIPLVALSPAVIAGAKEHTGSYAPALLGFAAIVFLLCGGLSLLLRERRGEAAAAH